MRILLVLIVIFVVVPCFAAEKNLVKAEDLIQAIWPDSYVTKTDFTDLKIYKTPSEDGLLKEGGMLSSGRLSYLSKLCFLNGLELTIHINDKNVKGFGDIHLTIKEQRVTSFVFYELEASLAFKSFRESGMYPEFIVDPRIDLSKQVKTEYKDWKNGAILADVASQLGATLHYFPMHRPTQLEGPDIVFQPVIILNDTSPK